MKKSLLLFVCIAIASLNSSLYAIEAKTKGYLLHGTEIALGALLLHRATQYIAQKVGQEMNAIRYQEIVEEKPKIKWVSAFNALPRDTRKTILKYSALTLATLATSLAFIIHGSVKIHHIRKQAL